MNMQKTCPRRQMHDFRPQCFGFMPASITNYKFLQYFENTCFLDPNSLSTIQDSFKDSILACKLTNQMRTNYKKRKYPPAASGNFAQKWLFCKTHILYNICGQNS